jgi:integrase
MPDLSTAIQSFLASRENQGLARGTVRRERDTLRWFLADVGNINTRSIRPEHIDIFWSKHTNWAQSSRNVNLAGLQAFFVWCRARGYMGRDVDPLAGMRKGKPEPRPRVIIPQDQFSTLLAGITDPRMRIAVGIGLYLFTRISETENLRWQDDRGDEMEVYRIKTKTIDILPICMELRAELDRWKLAYAAEVGQPVQPGWFIVPRREMARFEKGSRPGKGRPLIMGQLIPTEKATLTGSLRTILQRAGYYQPWEGGHTLRRSGAIALYHRLTHLGHDRAMRVCQAMLGHSSLSTTEIYLRLDLDRKLRNTLLAGQKMFPGEEEAEVLQLFGRSVAEARAETNSKSG